MAAPADTVRARIWGALPGRITPMDADTCTMELSSDSLPRIAAILACLDADYHRRRPAVLDHLATTATRALTAVRHAAS